MRLISSDSLEYCFPRVDVWQEYVEQKEKTAEVYKEIGLKLSDWFINFCEA